VPCEFALDGIDELLLGFYARRGGRLRADEPRSLLVQATDGSAMETTAPATAWTVDIGPDGATPRRGEGRADCVLRGPASDLYLALWNRRSTDDLHIEGDRSVLELWRERATVRWT
jgi:hypothetical protein